MDMDIDIPTPSYPSEASSAVAFSYGYQPVHTPLQSSTSTRLIHLEPGIGAEPIVLHLIQANLSHAPQYDALSYVWGNPAQTVSISCNGSPLPVTVNLHWALVHIRDANQAMFLWADAICINQKDTQERSHQVELMGLIYGSARKVYLAMGDAHDAEDVAPLISTVLSLWSGGRLSPAEWEFIRNDRRWYAVAYLMDQPWFSRVWVLQEAGLAKEPIVLYGRSRFSYRDLIRVVAWARNQVWCLKYQIPGLLVHLKWIDWRDGSSNGQETSFFDLVSHGAMLSCTDPRDYVYAFLGHFSALSRNGQRRVVIPNYEKDFREIYLEVSTWLLQETGLRILSSVEHTESTIEEPLPSWVVRWNVTIVQNDLSVLRKVKNATDPAFRLDAIWSSNMNISSSYAIHGSNLVLQGVLFDEVQASYRLTPAYGIEEPQFADISSSTVLSMGNMIDLLATASHDQYHIESSRVRARMVLFQTLSAGDFDGSLAKMAGAGDFELSFHAHDDVLQFRNDINAASIGRSFVITRGGYLGLAPKITRPGDVVSVVRSVEVPLMLRRRLNTGQFRLLGEAYVHNLVKDTLTERILCGKSQVQELVIS